MARASPEFAWTVPGSHWPMSCMAPLYVACAAAELPAPSHGAARKPSWKGSRAISFWKSSPALTKHGSDQSPVVTALSIPAWPQLRTARYAQ